MITLRQEIGGKTMLRRVVRCSSTDPWLLRLMPVVTTALCLGGAGWSGAAYAQGQQEASAGPAQSVTIGVEDILVTARKRAETIQDVPAAVAVLATADLEQYDMTSLAQVANFIPSLNITPASFGSGGSIQLRGVGTDALSVSLEQAVLLNIDGVSISHGRAVQSGMFDMATLEVVKGPQALYFGKNSTAGIIAIRSAEPTKSFFGRAVAGYDFTKDRAIGEMIVSGPLSEQIGVRLAMRASTSRGAMYNEAAYRPGADPLGFDLPGRDQRRVGGQDNYLGRLTLAYSPADSFKAVLRVTGNKVTDDGPTMGSVVRSCPVGGRPQAIYGVPDDAASSCGLKRTIWRGQGARETVVDWPYTKGSRPYSKFESLLSSLSLDWEFENLNLSSVTGFYHFKASAADNYDYSNSGQVMGAEATNFSSFSQEIRAQTDFEGPINLMVGGLVQKTELKFFNGSKIAPLPADSRTGKFHSWERRGKTNGETWSAFAEVTANLTDQIEVAGGARWTREIKDSYQFHTYVHEIIAPGFFPEGQRIVDKFRDNNLSPQVTVKWQPDRDTTFYGAYRTGFKAGGYSLSDIIFANSTADSGDFDSESAKGFEVGAKFALFDRSLRLNFAAYRYKFKDLQVNILDAATTSMRIENAASAKTTGFELDLQYRPRSLDGLVLRAAYNYNDAKYQDYIGPCYAGQTPAQGCNLLPNSGGIPTSQNMSGVPLVFAPRHSVTAGMSYEQPVAGDMRVAFSIDGRFSSSYEADYFNRPDGRAPKYATLDASVTLWGPNERWGLSLIGTNLTNKLYPVGGQGERPLTGSGTGTDSGVPADLLAQINDPREVGIRLTVQFGK